MHVRTHLLPNINYRCSSLTDHHLDLNYSSHYPIFDGTICLMEIIQVKQTLSRISPLLGLDLYQIMSHHVSTGKIFYSHDAPSFHLCWYLEVPFEYEIHNHLPTFSFWKNQSWLIHGPLLCRVRSSVSLVFIYLFVVENLGSILCLIRMQVRKWQKMGQLTFMEDLLSREELEIQGQLQSF